ncbi:MAG TPA: 3-hydroxyacyl-ACP dehydratase [Geobacter sp.]|nr:3-hydroxyacyl-ACP dehydratase [Geobacter sp.]
MKADLTLPLPAERFIPHRLPMRLVETLLSCEDAAGVVETAVAANGPLTGADGALDDVAFVELLAQGYAVIKGYDDLFNGKEISKGYLVGIKKIQVKGRAAAGDRLLIRIRTVGRFEGFAVAEGEVEREGEILACGSIKLWIVPSDPAAGGAA